MAELKRNTEMKSFTLEEWGNTKPEMFEVPKETADMLHDKAVELVNLCIEAGVPALVHMIVGQEPQYHSCRTVVNLMPISRTSTEILLADYTCRTGCRSAEEAMPELKAASNARYPAPEGVSIEGVETMTIEQFLDRLEKGLF